MDLIKNKATTSLTETDKRPAHAQVYQTLKAQILFGDLVPGQAVTIQGLTGSLEAGMTPVREAIRRLISDGALVFQGNRRVSVPLLSDADVEQVIFARKSVESELSRRAAANLSPKEIDQIEKIDQMLDRTIADGDVGGYLRLNHAFHETLYAHAEAPILFDLAERLWLRFGPSLRVVCGRFGTQNLPDRHKDIISALRAKDAEAAALATVQDIEQGMELITGSLSQP
ncbi:GntR family transcriptional regulator [Ruegeria sp. ANG-S4]|uniref:GntR family transcriptional regulator n=1 Tax=Ruegeria sp. ANG-S4 TaxID=1577904 RepID=UPI0005802AB1|nr:GntR family transcriptional regulator [Ruegeria sp. ANG-S4]KIC45217.1 GntR family transcriptional regulator [Ruegeria sp. ANG-S4]